MAAITANTGSNNWNTNGAWVGGVQPTAADDVTLPASAVVTIPTATTVLARSVTVQASATLAFASTTAVLSIGDGTAGAGNVALSVSGTATITLTGIGTINFLSTSATQQTVTTGGKTMPNLTFNGVGGSWILSDNCTATGATITVTNGSFAGNGKTITCGSFSSNNSNTRTIDFTNTTLTTASLTNGGLNFDVATNLTFTSTGSTININNQTPVWTNRTAPQTFNTVVFNVPASTSSFNFLCGNNASFANLTFNGGASKTNVLQLGYNFTVTTLLTLAGNTVTNRLMVASCNGSGTVTPGTSHTITAASVSIANVDMEDVTGAGAATWSGTSFGDTGGNSNITFTTPATQTWSGTSGGNWSANAWSGRVPLPQDDVVINAAFSASQTITNDMPRLGKSINWTGATGTPTWSIAGTSTNVYGSITLISGMAALTGAQVMQLCGRGNFTLTNAGKTWPSSLNIAAPNGTYTLQDGVISAVAININDGTFVTNSNSIQCTQFQSASGRTRALTAGTSTITCTTTAATNPVNVSNTTGLTWSAASATFVVSTASANARTFIGGGQTFGTLTYTVAGSTGSLTITGSNTFDTINFSDVTNARSLLLTAGTTTTITSSFNVNGTSGKLMTIDSATAATHTLSKSSGTVSCDYLSIKNSGATGGASWYAGANSTDVSGNTGWIFTAPPTGNPNLLMMGVG